MRLTSLCIGLAIAPSAWAEDLNDNGCNDAYEVGTTCVDNTASIGPEVSFSADVIVAPRATLGGRLNHASNPLPVATGVVVARQATLGVDHILGADTFIGRSSTAGADLTTLTDVSVGYAAQLGHDVTLGANAIVGNLVQVGDYASLGSNAIVARSTTIANAVSSGQGSVINGIVGPDGTIESDVRVELGARVRKQATLLQGARIEATARIGRGARIEAGATVHGTVQANAVVGAGATVGLGAVIERGGELCAATVLADNTSIPSGETYPEQGCTALPSCKAIFDSGAATGDHLYSIDPDGTGSGDAFDAYCDMTTDGGGWTLIYQVNAVGCTQYDSEDVFENRSTFGTLADDNFLPPYFYTVPFTESYMVDEDHSVPVFSTSTFSSGTVNDFLDTVDPLWPGVALWTGGSRTSFALLSGGTSDNRFSNGDLRGAFNINQSDIPNSLSPPVSYTYATGETHLITDSAQGTGARRYAVALQPVAGVALDQRYQLFVR